MKKKNPGGRTATATGAACTLLAGLSATAPAQADDVLPVPAATDWVGAGQATGVVSGTTFNVNQTSENVTLNWQSFNIGSDNTVNFLQPSSTSVALNRIFQADPVSIRGALNANGEVYLLSQNGILFGSTAQVNVRGLIASTLNLTPLAESVGLTGPLTINEPAFAAARDADGNATSGDIHIQSGARITTPEGGRVFAFASNVLNEGTIRTPGGQTVLAAGESVFLSATDPSVRGLVVEVSGGGTASNGATLPAGTPAGTVAPGTIEAARGNVSLVGLAVNQNGRISASSAVRSGGSVRLMARESQTTGGGTTAPSVGGTLTFGAGSVTEANPDLADKEVTLDANEQPKGSVTGFGHQVVARTGSLIAAHGGTVNLQATASGGVAGGDPASTSRVYLEGGSRIDVSGEDVDLPASRNALTVRLQGAELRDSPIQRDSPLRGQEVTVDVRRRGTTADGRAWVGTPLADLNEAAQGVRRSVGERNSAGGTVTLRSDGDVISAQGSAIDVSGGAVRYADGGVQTSLLIRDGVITDIAAADPNVVYDGVFGSGQRVHSRWGVVEEFQSAFYGAATQAATGTGSYVEGKDAGTVSVAGSRVVLDGQMTAGTTRGDFQRAPAASFTGAHRPADQAPRGGRLVVGFADAAIEELPNFGAGSARFGALPVLAAVPDFDPLRDPLPELPADVTIPVAIFREDNFTSLDLFANARIELSEDTSLDLGPGGELRLTGGEIAFDGRVSAAAGSVSLTTRRTADFEGSKGRIDFGGTVDVRGLWVNDVVAIEQPGTQLDRLAINGGSVRIEASQRAGADEAGGLFFGDASVINAGGGGWVNSAGRVVGGTGGSIAIVTRRGVDAAPVDLELGGTMSAYGIDNGGTLTVQASDICIAVTMCETLESQTTAWLTPEDLENGGFRGYSFVADGGSVVIADGTTVRLRQRNRLLDAAYARHANRSDIGAFSALGELPDILRRPVDFSATSRVRFNATDAFFHDDFQAAGYLHFGSGAQLLADPGARIDLASDTRLFADGTILAPAGTITLTIASAINGSRFGEFMPSQSLWLGSNAALLAPGTSRIVTDDFGRRSGNVLAGGTVRLDARSGYVITERGSRIDASGFSDTLDITPSGGSQQALTPERVTVMADAGQIDIRAAEGILLGGSLDASAAGSGGNAGSLVVTLDAGNRNDDTTDPAITADSLGLSMAPRRVIVTNESFDDAIDDLEPGESIDSRHAGVAIVDPDLVAAGGFGDVTLRAMNFQRESVSVGRVRFEGDVSLAASRRLTLDAAGIESNGGTARVQAPYVAIGNHDMRQMDAVTAVPDFAPERGTLEVSGSFIDLVGATRLVGFGTSAFSSTGDLRLRGAQIPGRTRIAGSLESTGDIHFTARQVYAPTLHEFTVGVRDNPDAGIAIDAVGTPTPVLSAGSRLTFEAPEIEQRGVIKAPLGEIVLDASRDLTLAAGSLTSTSLESQLVPFGRVEVGTDWVYALDARGANSLRLVYTEQANRPADDLPRQFVQLRAPNVRLADGAVLDQSGGGDLMAYEFQAGLAGSFDVLDPSIGTRNYAIVPLLDPDFAPIDAQESLLFAPRAGESVELMSSLPGLPSGRYALLPARYALLPGAFLVSAVNGFQDLSPGAVLPFAQGGAVVAGRRVFADGSQGDSRTSGFVIRSRADIARLAQYDTYRASDFATGFNGAPLPQDGGSTRIEAALSLELGGTIRAAGAAGGRGASVAITGENLAVIANRDAHTADAGALLLDADGLNRLGAESLILGATRSFDEDGAHLAVAARQVEVDAGATLTGPEVILAATETVRVETGAAVRGRGAGSITAGTLSTQGDGAVLRVSSSGQGEFLRTNASGSTGLLDIETGAEIAATGATLLSGAADVSFAGNLLMDRGSLNIDAASINLGTPEVPASGFTLTGAALESLTVDELRLSARVSVDVFEPLDVALNRLVLNTPTINGHLSAGEVASISLDSLEISNPARHAGGPAGLGAGSLELRTNDLALGVGDVAVNGFSEVSLASTGRITARGASSAIETVYETGRLAVDGDLALTASVITGDGNADLTIAATGDVRIASSGVAPAGTTALGARLAISGRSIEQNGRIEVKSGTVALRAVGADADDSVTLGQGAVIDVTGSLERFEGVDAYARAGEVTLAAANGGIELLAGSRVDVAAHASGGDAGRLTLQAPNGVLVAAGTLAGGAAAGFDGGAASADVRTLGDFSAFNAQLESGGFDGDRALRVREGDIVVGAADVVRADAVSLVADAGAVRVAGRIDVSGEDAGRIALSARDDVRVQAGASLIARGSGAGDAGGRVSLHSVSGGVAIESGARVDVSAGSADAEGGRVDVRVTRAIANTLVDADAGNDALSLDGSIVGARRIDVEAYERYVELDGEIDGTDVSAFNNTRYDDAAAFIAASDAGIRTALGAHAAGSEFHLLAGIEIAADELNPSLRLTSTWDLSQWRFGGEAGVLTLRSAGDLTFDASLSDGFIGTTDLRTNALPQLGADDSWSYRLVGGADLSSADLMATAATGNISIAPGLVSSGNGRPRPVAIRTGTGDISLAAAGDITLGNRASVIYTAGRNLGEGIPLGTAIGTLQNRPYPLEGGDITLDAGGSVRGVAPDLRGDLNAYGTQLVNNWLFRQGASDESALGVGRRATGWTVAFERFEQGVGTLAGGNLSVTAGGDLDNLSLSIPSIGMQVGGTSVDTSEVRVVGGGDLEVRTGGDIAGGVFYVGKGDADIQAGGSVLTGRPISDGDAIPLHTVLALGDGSMRVDARGALDLEAIVNPTLLVQSPLQKQFITTRNSYFSTYGDDSAVELSSLVGDVSLYNNRDAIQGSRVFGLDFGGTEESGFEQLALSLYAPVLRIAAHRGDINVNGGFTLFPSVQGDLQLLADQNLNIRAAVNLADRDPATLPSLATPSANLVKINSLEPASRRFGADVIHLGDAPAEPVRFIARHGDIVTDPTGVFLTSKPAEFHAGRDLVNLTAIVQNVHAGDVSVFSAGRDIRYPALRSVDGGIIPNDAGIDIAGPGRAVLTAGRDIDLGASRGISSLGDTTNQALADQGADIALLAGVGANGPAIDAFAAKYDVSADLPAVLDKFYGILRAAGRRNAPLPNDQRSYADAFEAIATLFPEKDYEGAIDMFFSRVYTLDGGDIDLLLPGGAVNVGLAAPPAAFGLNKEAAQLGLVAQSAGTVRAFLDENFEVNESRVFAADGGDVLVWSSNGDIDAGRGAKTSISAPPPIITLDPDTGQVTVTFPPALTGSGIRTLTSTPGRAFGSVDLITPRGVVDASEAGIETLGNLTIAAVQVLGTQNIKVGGVSTGVPVDTGGLSASLTGVSAVSSSAAAASAELGAASDKPKQAPIADAAMSFLELFVIGFGEGVCNPKDVECMQRQKPKESAE